MWSNVSDKESKTIEKFMRNIRHINILNACIIQAYDETPKALYAFNLSFSLLGLYSLHWRCNALLISQQKPSQLKWDIIKEHIKMINVRERIGLIIIIYVYY